MPQHALTTAWDRADSATRVHWINEIVELSDMMGRISAKNEARRRISAETGIPYDELIRREDAEFFARQIETENAETGTDYWNARKCKKVSHGVHR